MWSWTGEHTASCKACGCQTVDVLSRLLASIYGRPTTIPRASDVQLPSAVDHEHTHKGVGGKVSQELMPGAPMFCLSIELLDIFHEILETVYTGSRRKVDGRFRSRPGDEELLGNSLKLNHQLDQFLASTPERLSTFIATSSTNCDQACDLSLHEQALVTRFVLSPLRSSHSMSFPTSASPNNDQVPVRADNALTPADLVRSLRNIPPGIDFQSRNQRFEGMLQLMLAIFGAASTQRSPGRKFASPSRRLACRLL